MSDWPTAENERVASAASPSIPPELLDEDELAGPLWDRFRDRALEEGVDPELAELGRRLMREAFVQRWSPRLGRECGLEDEGEAMLELACDDPEAAEERWRELLSR